MLRRLFRPQVVLPTAAVSGTGVVGFLGGSLGILSWSTVMFLLVTVAVAVVVLLLVWWVVRRQQAAGLSEELVRRQERNLAGASPERRANLQPITEEFRRNIEFLRKLKKKNGIPAIYYLPWYMVIGAPSSGKSVLLRGSDFRFCVNDTPLKEGGTLHCDWWFTNQAIFLDTAGRLTVHEGGAADKTEWEQLLKLLRRFRRKRPIDGILVTVESNFLLEKSEREIQAYARQVRERIERATEGLRIRMPIFVALTKCDLVEGFKEFFDALPGAAQGQILGHTNASMTYEGSEQAEEIFRGVADRLRALRPALMEEEGSSGNRRLMFPFPEEFENLGDPLVAFLDGLFRADMYTRSPAFAGLYFTSGTQEGTTVSRYFRRVGEALGMAPEALGRTFALEAEQKKPYFVHDMFWKVIAPAVGLAVPVDSEKDARRRQAWGVAAAAGALVLGILATVSFVRNGAFLAAYPERLAEALDRTGEVDAARLGPSLQEGLQAFGEAADVVLELNRHPILDNWGLNQRGRLRADTRELFRDHFGKKLWSSFGPLLHAGLEGDGRLNLSCAERTNLLLGYLGLQGAGRGEAPPQAAKRLLEVILARTDTRPEKSDQEALAKAWSIYGETRSSEGADPDLSAPARVAAETCAEEADPVAALQRIQNDCYPVVGQACFPRLEAIASVTREALDARRRGFEGLEKQLRGKIDDETRDRLRQVLEDLKRAGGARKGGALIAGFGAGGGAKPEDGAACVETYFKSVAPDLREMVRKGAQFRSSMERQQKLGAGGQTAVVEHEARAQLTEIKMAMATGVEILNAACAGQEVDLRTDAVHRIALGHATATVGGPARPGSPRAQAGCAGRGVWEATCSRLASEKNRLILGEATPGGQARGLAAIEAEARVCARNFETHWGRELTRPEPAASGDAPGLAGAAGALTGKIARIGAEVQGLECPTVPTLETGPEKIAALLRDLGGGLASYEDFAARASDWIGTQVRAGKRAEVVERTMQGEGPVAELCAHIDAIRQPELAQVLSAPVIRQWNATVLGGLAANIRTSWQQRLLGISELTRRYPFKPGGDTHAALGIAQEWLEPKSGRLMQLYYQMAPDAGGGGNGSPCDLRVKANLGPATAALLRRAKSVSDVIFADLDQGKPAQRLTFTFDRVEFEDPEALQRYNVRITQVSLVLAGQTLAYIMDQPAPRTLVVPVPSSGPVNSYVEVSVLGDKRKADVRPARLERGGEWSPLALLRQAEMQPAGGKVRLTWRVPYGAGPPFVVVSVLGDEKVRRLIETNFEMEPTDSPDR